MKIGKSVLQKNYFIVFVPNLKKFGQHCIKVTTEEHFLLFRNNSKDQNHLDEVQDSKITTITLPKHVI